MKLLQAGTLDRRITIQQKSVVQAPSYAILTGSSGSYFSTPDSVANNITGDIDIRIKVSLDDWTPSSSQLFVAKDDAVSQRAYAFLVSSSAPTKLRFIWSTDGTNVTIVNSTSTHGIADGATKWVRVTRDADNGAVNCVITFYLSDDGVTWTQLGDQILDANYGNLHNSTYINTIGTFSSSPVLFLSGKVYRAQIYNGINGTLAVDFNPTTWAGGTTWTATTGEVWTQNGSASIGSDYGTESVTWTTFASRIAAQVLDSLPSRAESVQGQVIVGTRPARVRIRYRAGIKPDMRIIMHDGATDRTMQIVAGPAELGRKEGIEFMVDEYSTQGGA